MCFLESLLNFNKVMFKLFRTNKLKKKITIKSAPSRMGTSMTPIFFELPRPVWRYISKAPLKPVKLG